MNEQQVERASLIATLITKQLQDDLATAEWNDLETWLNESNCNCMLYEELQNYDQLGQSLAELHSFDADAGLERIKEKIQILPPLNPAS